MIVGVMIGKFLPVIPDMWGKMQVAGISIPIALLKWLMIYPMMMKVDFKSIKQVGKNSKGLIITWIVNWLIKPFTMYGIAYLFLFVLFKSVISADLATEYLAGAVLLGVAPCTAMVFVWSSLTKGNPPYTVVQVATNDLIILIALPAFWLLSFSFCTEKGSVHFHNARSRSGLIYTFSILLIYTSYLFILPDHLHLPKASLPQSAPPPPRYGCRDGWHNTQRSAGKAWRFPLQTPASREAHGR